jgi:lipopolysaccharide/colanic/teichoic acid biosynthesis glycosyltransferase
VGREMRFPLPTSRASALGKKEFGDIVILTLSPILVLLIYDIFRQSVGVTAVVFYISAELACSLAMVWAWRARGVSRSFGVFDGITLAAGAAIAELLAASLVVRGAPALRAHGQLFVAHAFVLAAAMIGLRIALEMGWRFGDRKRVRRLSSKAEKNNILIISSGGVFPGLIEALCEQLRLSNSKLIAILDGDREYVGRRIKGVNVLGSPWDIESIMEEYKIHGVDIGCVLFAGLISSYPDRLVEKVSEVCRRRQASFHSLFDYLAHVSSRQIRETERDLGVRDQGISLPGYLRWKRVVDAFFALLLLVLLLPVFIGVAVIVFADVGAPIIFWQQRLGARGREFFLYKFRTMRSLGRGEQASDEKRLSRIGQLLRDTSLDELPQLFNVLLGDMSIIGPRPLLPVDQPQDTLVRLSVKPGITGWAQVNGRKNLTPEEKECLDSWYVRNASLGLDFIIVLKTAGMVLNAALRKDPPERLDLEIKTQVIMDNGSLSS